ncbi:MAG: Stk1 family PASTA domain-containing Ser/Thr kinase [Clostridia bacterium]|nr:Stk1 family PASTA domain-containing Ser/Thr kinase [Clostridia bacterium]
MGNYAGKIIDGRYEIKEIIGVGGMAIVYKAYDNIDDRIVAVKILKEEFLANEEFRRRFKNESKAIAVMSHPNIVRVFDVSFGEKLQYIVMEYIEGITLKEYIESLKIVNIQEAVHFTIQVLKALQHAHDKGIVHRDIKPQNIMLLQDGTIKVTDFGIARFSRGDSRTLVESAIGSVHYMSPEQARGEITDEKADIYSVGVVLYEMITGELPFDSDSAVSVAIMQLEANAKKPTQINPDIPLGLEQIVNRAMQKEAKNRYQSASEMIMDLEEFKKNPDIKFNYNYFVDEEPTNVVEGLSKVMVNKSVSENYENDSEFDEENEEESSKIKKGPIVASIVAGVVAAVIIIISLLWFFTDVFNNAKVQVPNFVGMNYYNEIDGNPRYKDFKFKVNLVTGKDINSEPGKVVSQNPPSGKKIKIGGEVTLDIVASGVKQKIPLVVGFALNDANQALKQLGFNNVEVKFEYSPDSVKGTVLKVEPSEGTEVDVSEKVVIYVASDVDERNVEVPNLIGINLEDAKAYLKEKDLSLGTVTEVPNTHKKGIIVFQSVDPKTPVPRNSKINVEISSGVVETKPQTREKSITIKLPMKKIAGQPVNGTLIVFQNNIKVMDEVVLLNGEDISISVSGSKANEKILVQVGVVPINYYKCTIDFTQDPPEITSQRYEN